MQSVTERCVQWTVLTKGERRVKSWKGCLEMAGCRDEVKPSAGFVKTTGSLPPGVTAAAIYGV